MTVALAIAAPFLASLSAVSARRRFGTWSAWLVLLLWAYLYGRLLAGELWWSEPQLFFPGLDDAVWAFVAALVMGLILHSFPPKRPRFLLQVGIVGIAGLVVQWAGSQPPVLPPAIEGILTAFDGYLLGLVLACWLIGLLVRDFTRRRRARSPERGGEREA